MAYQPSLFDPIPVEPEHYRDPRTLVRPTDPDTSHAAAARASKRGPSQRARIWNALVVAGTATDYELSIATGLLRSSAGKRRQELTDLGLVEATDERRRTDTGSLAVVWRPVAGSTYAGVSR